MRSSWSMAWPASLSGFVSKGVIGSPWCGGGGEGGGGCEGCGSEFAAELGDGAEDGLLGGVAGDAEGVGDDLDGLVFHVAEDEGGAFHGGEG